MTIWEINKMGNILSDSYDEALDKMQQRRTTTQPTGDTPVVKTVTKTYTVTLPRGHVEEVSEGWLKEMRKWLNNEFGDDIFHYNHCSELPLPHNGESHRFVYRGPTQHQRFMDIKFEDKE
jgi:hypothetical protein